jgi:hypothetical protein
MRVIIYLEPRNINMSEITLVFQFILAALSLGFFALACAVGLVAAIVVIAGRIIALFALTPTSTADARASRDYAPISPDQWESQPSPSQCVNDPAR